MAIVYDSPEHTEHDEERTQMVVDKGRPNGSLHSRQKRSIADACEWLRLTQTRDKKALIFVLTSPGHTSLANTPKFISKFVDNMRTNYGMGDFVWVREMTKAGYPHFHFVAHWHPAKWFLTDNDNQTKKENAINHTTFESRVTQISKYWSGLFGSDAKNSVRFGSYNPRTKRRTFYLSTDKHAWYLTKYLGKNIGSGSLDYLMEAGFPQARYKKTVRSFGMSENVALLSEPELFESYQHTTEARLAPTAQIDPETMTQKFIEVRTTERLFGNEINILRESDVREYDWRWTGHGETFIGFKLKKSNGRG
jgi:hypothetical protein